MKYTWSTHETTYKSANFSCLLSIISYSFGSKPFTVIFEVSECSFMYNFVFIKYLFHISIPWNLNTYKNQTNFPSYHTTSLFLYLVKVIEKPEKSLQIIIIILCIQNKNTMSTLENDVDDNDSDKTDKHFKVTEL